jgi:hypothetical protein
MRLGLARTASYPIASARGAGLGKGDLGLRTCAPRRQLSEALQAEKLEKVPRSEPRVGRGRVQVWIYGEACLQPLFGDFYTCDLKFGCRIGIRQRGSICRLPPSNRKFCRFAAWFEELLSGDISPLDKRHKLDFTDLAPFGRFWPASGEQAIHLAVDGIAFFFPAYERASRHSTSPKMNFARQRIVEARSAQVIFSENALGKRCVSIFPTNHRGLPLAQGPATLSGIIYPDWRALCKTMQAPPARTIFAQRPFALSRVSAPIRT